MKVYKISMTGDFGDTDSAARWTSRKSDIPALKRELRAMCMDDSQPDPQAEAIVFKPTVDGIVDMLNSFAR